MTTTTEHFPTTLDPERDKPLEPCPAWCRDGHDALYAAGFGDFSTLVEYQQARARFRAHQSRTVEALLQNETRSASTGIDTMPDSWDLVTLQGQHMHPVIQLGTDSVGASYVTMTPNEAFRLAQALFSQVIAIEGAQR